MKIVFTGISVCVCVDRRGCDGVSHVKESENLNTLSLLWQPLQPAIISVKINCLSSEFGAKKHGKWILSYILLLLLLLLLLLGGEKGILLQISMTIFNGEEYLQRSGCNIKVIIIMIMCWWVYIINISFDFRYLKIKEVIENRSKTNRK